MQCLGGVVYRATLTFEPPPHQYVKRVWQVQVSLWLILGIAVVLRSHDFLYGVLWWIGGVAFAGGIYLFEFLGDRWAAASGLERR